MAKHRVRYFEKSIGRDRAGRFTRKGVRSTVKVPRPPTKTSGLPKYLILQDGTRVLTTGPYGRQVLPLLDMLQGLGLTLPETPIPVSELKSAYDGIKGKRLEIEEPDDEEEDREPCRCPHVAHVTPGSGWHRFGALRAGVVAGRCPRCQREHPGRVARRRGVGRRARGRAPVPARARKPAPRAPTAPRTLVARRPAPPTITVRRDRFGRFNARGRTVQTIRVRRRR